MEEGLAKNTPGKKLRDILSGATLLPPTPKEITDYIQTTLGEETCMRNPRLALDNKALFEMIEALSENERESLNKYAGFFRIYMAPLLIFALEKRGKGWAVYENIVRSNLALHVMFSILEHRTKPKERKAFTTYLKENIARIKVEANVDQLEKEHRELFPGNARRIGVFFTKHLTVKEQNDMVEDYKHKEQSEGKERFPNIQEVINDIYGSKRSAFSHDLGIDHLWKDNYKLFFERKNGKGNLIAAYPDISVDRFLAMSWLAILRSFGYPT